MPYSAHLSPSIPPANYDIGRQLPLYQVPAPAQLLTSNMENQPVEGSEGQVPVAVRIQAFCFSLWGPLVGQLTWVSGESHPEDCPPVGMLSSWPIE